MKRPLFLILTITFASLGFSLHAQGPGKGSGKGHGKGKGGMPDEMREVIHGLFDGHEKFQRKVEVTDTGYRATTTTEDKVLAGFLQAHVRQMEGRLKSGLMVRRWDPAYEEFVTHYDDINIEITNIEGGISVVATGKTEDSRKVARNHAGIIGKFIEHGWSEHDKAHTAVLTGRKVAQSVTDAELGETKMIHQVGALFLASQPGHDELKLAKERGIKTVVSVRHSDEGDFDERQIVAGLGMKFVHIPWNGEEELTDHIFDEVRATFQTADHPLLFHCGTANRAAGAWLAWRVLDQAVEVEKAVGEARELGLGSEAYEGKARDYIEKRKAVAEMSDKKSKACLEIGEKASSALMDNLSTQLKAAMAGGDIKAAISVCKAVAQPISVATSEGIPGVTVGRTSLKTRNAAPNGPDASDRQILTQWEHMAKHSHAIEPTLMPIHENAVRYYRPIFVQEVCLKCHGSADMIDGQVADFLAESYPNDQALGYKAGDLRGAFRVEIDLEKALD